MIFCTGFMIAESAVMGRLILHNRDKVPISTYVLASGTRRHHSRIGLTDLQSRSDLQ